MLQARAFSLYQQAQLWSRGPPLCSSFPNHKSLLAECWLHDNLSNQTEAIQTVWLQRKGFVTQTDIKCNSTDCINITNTCYSKVVCKFIKQKSLQTLYTVNRVLIIFGMWVHFLDVMKFKQKEISDLCAEYQLNKRILESRIINIWNEDGVTGKTQ